MKTQVALTVIVALSAPAMAGKTVSSVDNSAAIEQSSFAQHYQPAQRRSAIQPLQQNYILQLHDEPLATYQGGIPNLTATAANNGSKIQLNSVAAKTYKQHIQKQQDRLKTTMRQRLPNTEVIRQFDTLFNGMTVSVTNTSMSQLAALPGVKAVYPERLYYAQMDRSLDLIQASSAWEQLDGRSSAGKGIRVAVIDSGIRPENPMFDDSNMDAPASRPADDYCALTDPSFCNNKLIAARWSVPTFPVAEQEHMSPLGFDGHGTHVAGTAVGVPTDIEFAGQPLTISGVAPGAYLMSYKALYATTDDPTRASGSNTMLLEALEYAVNDGADVINNSWGGGAGADPTSSPYAQAFEAAEAAGVVVVSAAGNAGAGPQTIGCPGCIESGITVANTTHGRFFANELTVGSLSGILAIQGSGSTKLSADVIGPIVSAVSIDPDNAEGCAPFANESLTGAIALISRGNCTFQDKIDNAATAGAAALVVYNNQPDQPITMGLAQTSIPAVMISQESGNDALAELGGSAEAITATIRAETSRVIDTAFSDFTANSSARGPNGNPNVLKPDIAAPGSSILSAMSPEGIGNGGQQFALLSGTSMASPHVAGAAALVRAMHPDWSAVEIKTALTSTSYNVGLTKEDTVTPADPFDIGAGRVDLNAVSKAVLTFDKASFADALCVAKCSFTATVTNRGNEEGSWAVSASVEGATTSLTSETITLSAGASTEIELAVDSTFSDKGGWLFGQLNLSGETDAHLPIAIYPEASSDVTQLAFSGIESINYGESGAISGSFTNKDFTGSVTVQMETSDEVSFVVGSGSIQTSGAITDVQEVNDDDGFISWTGRLDPIQLSASFVGASGVPSFASAENQIPCSRGCDEVSFSYELPAFEHHGKTYTSLTISDNGIVIPGASQNTSGTWSNQQLPTDVEPNNVIAPFWSDFDLNDGTDEDSGSGTLHIYGAGDYIVVEWNNVAAWVNTGAGEVDSGNRYTFQVFLGYGAAIGDNWFNYVSIDELPSRLTVGVEDISGGVGESVYYNGEGDAPVSDSYVQLATVAAGVINLSAEVIANVIDVAADDRFEATEDESSTFDVVSNDSAAVTVPLHLSATHDGNNLQAVRLLDIVGATPSTITVTAPPMHGSVVVNDDLSVAYTPEANFFGEDSFRYDAIDAKDMVIGRATATIIVNNVNDAPVAEELVQTNVVLGSTARIELLANDIDNDELSWAATQQEGPAVEFSVDGNILSFVVPDVAEGTVISFSVVANDGEFNSNAVTVSTTVQPRPPEIEGSGSSSSSGSLGWLTLLLIPAAIRRRR